MVLELSSKLIIAFNTTNFDFFYCQMFQSFSLQHCIVFNNREVMTTPNSITGNLKKTPNLLHSSGGVLCSCKNEQEDLCPQIWSDHHHILLSKKK